MSDLISREALLLTLCENCGKAGMCRIPCVDYDLIIQAPSVNAEPVRHGRWYKPTGMMPTNHHGKHRCSECGDMALLERPGREELSAYCPNCGAKME